MKRIESFHELTHKMINPLDNPDFYALLICDTRDPFSECHDEDFGKYSDKAWIKLWKNVLNEYLKNVPSKNDRAVMEEIRRKVAKGERVSLKDYYGRGIGDFLGTSIDTISNSSTSWFYYRSYILNPQLTDTHIFVKSIKHRLYLAIDTGYRPEMAKQIIEKCTKNKIPYLFKTRICQIRADRNNRSDTMVIYLADKNQVVEYTNMINEIFEENPELKMHTHKAPPHLGIIDDYIGYGYEPDNLPGKKKVSYSGALNDIRNDFFRLKDTSREELSYKMFDKLEKISYKYTNLGLEQPEEYERIKNLIENQKNSQSNFETDRIDSEDIEKMKQYVSYYFSICKKMGKESNIVKEIKQHFMNSEFGRKFPTLSGINKNNIQKNEINGR